MSSNSFSVDDVFHADDGFEQSRASKTAKKIALWALHLAHLALLVYSAAHGISATLNFSGTHDWQKAAGIVGIIVTESVMQALYIAALNRGINGDAQRIVAGLTYLVGLCLSAFGILVDSQINAGTELAGVLAAYLLWGLPISPLVSGVGATLVHLLEPEQSRQREQAKLRTKLEDDRFKATIAIERSEMEEEKALAALKVMSRKAVIQELYNCYTSDEIQADIRQTAKANLPELLRGSGIMSGQVLPELKVDSPTPLPSEPIKPRVEEADSHLAPIAEEKNGVGREDFLAAR